MRPPGEGPYWPGREPGGTAFPGRNGSPPGFRYPGKRPGFEPCGCESVARTHIRSVAPRVLRAVRTTRALRGTTSGRRRGWGSQRVADGQRVLMPTTRGLQSQKFWDWWRWSVGIIPSVDHEPTTTPGNGPRCAVRWMQRLLPRASGHPCCAAGRRARHRGADMPGPGRTHAGRANVVPGPAPWWKMRGIQTRATVARVASISAGRTLPTGRALGKIPSHTGQPSDRWTLAFRAPHLTALKKGAPTCTGPRFVGLSSAGHSTPAVTFMREATGAPRGRKVANPQLRPHAQDRPATKLPKSLTVWTSAPRWSQASGLRKVANGDDSTHAQGADWAGETCPVQPPP